MFPSDLVAPVKVLSRREFWLAHGELLAAHARKLLIPSIGGTPPDLYALYLAVAMRGGRAEVTRAKQWTQVATSLGVPESLRNRSYQIKRLHANMLLDQIGVLGGMAEHAGAGAAAAPAAAPEAQQALTERPARKREREAQRSGDGDGGGGRTGAQRERKQQQAEQPGGEEQPQPQRHEQQQEQQRDRQTQTQRQHPLFVSPHPAQGLLRDLPTASRFAGSSAATASADSGGDAWGRAGVPLALELASGALLLASLTKPGALPLQGSCARRMSPISETPGDGSQGFPAAAAGSTDSGGQHARAVLRDLLTPFDLNRWTPLAELRAFSELPMCIRPAPPSAAAPMAGNMRQQQQQQQCLSPLVQHALVSGVPHDFDFDHASYVHGDLPPQQKPHGCDVSGRGAAAGTAAAAAAQAAVTAGPPSVPVRCPLAATQQQQQQQQQQQCLCPPVRHALAADSLQDFDPADAPAVDEAVQQRLSGGGNAGGWRVETAIAAAALAPAMAIAAVLPPVPRRTVTGQLHRLPSAAIAAADGVQLAVQQQSHLSPPLPSHASVAEMSQGFDSVGALGGGGDPLTPLDLDLCTPLVELRALSELPRRAGPPLSAAATGVPLRPTQQPEQPLGQTLWHVSAAETPQGFEFFYKDDSPPQPQPYGSGNGRWRCEATAAPSPPPPPIVLATSLAPMPTRMADSQPPSAAAGPPPPLPLPPLLPDGVTATRPVNSVDSVPLNSGNNASFTGLQPPPFACPDVGSLPMGPLGSLSKRSLGTSSLGDVANLIIGYLHGGPDVADVGACLAAAAAVAQQQQQQRRRLPAPSTSPRARQAPPPPVLVAAASAAQQQAPQPWAPGAHSPAYPASESVLLLVPRRISRGPNRRVSAGPRSPWEP